ncbi:hypothetical protein NHX12_014121 [Muraenolepis orangiensis]|uniref:Uncharacterized protein n=1 Tax=Muraenolepis orangiensis TaxID=630683 RepID=A0A9Q0I3G9_9TELE|nr:hypothetical protein NHX12_014121 [Muraenolepis orangiensis]
MWKENIDTEEVYKAGTCGPLLVLLHGGGHCPILGRLHCEQCDGGAPQNAELVELTSSQWNAIEWSVKSGQIKNLESARVSVVGQIKKCEVEEVVLEPASPVEDVVVKGNEELYDQNHLNDKENSTTDVSLSDIQVS